MAMEAYKVSRQKSCLQCAAAKRRCHPQTPQCPRCASKGLPCLYKNEPLKTKRMRMSSHADFDLSPTDTSSSRLLTSGSEYAGPAVEHVFQLANIRYDLLVDPDFFQNALSQSTSVPYPLQDGNMEIWYMDRWAVNQLVRSFKSFPSTFSKSRTTPFIHPRLYDAWLPESIADVFAASSAYCLRTNDTEQMVFRLLEQKTLQLLRQDSTTWSIDEHLAAVQSLILLCSIQLFDGSEKPRLFAESTMDTLDLWTAQLHGRMTNLGEESKWPAWMFAESFRRTILISLFLAGTYSGLTKGYCVNVPRMENVPFTFRATLWDAENEPSWRSSKELTEPKMIEYGAFFNMWSRGQLSLDLEYFQKLLLIPCAGEKYRNVLEIEM